MKIDDCVAIVTGANRGIGEAFVQALLEAGAAKVYVGTRKKENALMLEESYPGRAVAIPLDVTSEASVAAAAEVCSDVNVVINNAGAFCNELLLSASTMDAARQEMAVNYFGPLAMARAFAQILSTNGGGSILNVLSVGAIIAVPNMGGYSPSKFAAHALTTILRAELAQQGTHVGCLIVGSVDTRMAAHVGGRKENPSTIAKAGLAALRNDMREMDTDEFATTMRAALHRDPATLERRLADAVYATEVHTGR